MDASEPPDAPEDDSRTWLSSKLQTLRDSLVPTDGADASSCVDEVAVPMLTTLIAGSNAIMLFMAKQEQPAVLSSFVACVAKVALGLSVVTIPLDPTTQTSEFAERLFSRTGTFISSSPTRESFADGLSPASPNSPGTMGSIESRNTFGLADNRKVTPVAPRATLSGDKQPPSPRRGIPSAGTRQSLVPGISRKYSLGIGAGRKLPGVVILENFHLASKDIHSFVSDMLVKKQVSDRYQVHNFPKPFLVIATMPQQASNRKLGLPNHLVDLFCLSNSLEQPVPRPLPQASDRSTALISSEDLDRLQRKYEVIAFHGDLMRYIWDLVTCIRQHQLVFTPPTTRGRSDLASASRAVASLFGAEFVTTSHIQLVFDKALAHRIVLTSSRNPPAAGERSAGKGPVAVDVCNDCLDTVQAPS